MKRNRWGANWQGESSVPAGLSGVIGIAAGYSHSLALKNDDGTVVGWGLNDAGQATPPSGLQNVIAISAGASHSLALRADGAVITIWGDCSSFGGCTPPALETVTAISAGWEYSLALANDGTVHAWGAGDFGKTDVPAGLIGVMAISAGLYNSYALQGDGTIAAWGDNSFGQIDDSANVNAVAVAAGKLYHGLALRGDGSVVGWGQDSHGEADPPATLTGVTAISAGAFHSLALKADGTVVGWGDNSSGQITIPPALQQSTIIVTAEDLAGNINTASVTVNRTPDAAGNLTDPVQLSATPVSGFDPVIVTFTPQASVPGTIQHVRYDWDGDGINEEDAGTSLASVQHTYAAGQFFPVVTIETTVQATTLKFSSAGGWNSSDGGRLRINVQTDADHDSLPDTWEYYWFGNYSHSGDELDVNGSTLLDDYQNSADPNVINFTIVAPNPYVNQINIPLQVNLRGGTPYYYAILVNDTDQSHAVWLPYTGANLTATVGSTEGAYQVWVGLKGLPSEATQTWEETTVTLDTTPPTVTVTYPGASVVSQPMIDVQGTVSEDLKSLTFDVSNSSGVLTGKRGYFSEQFYDTSLKKFTTRSLNLLNSQ